MKKRLEKILFAFWAVFTASILLLSVRGNPGNPSAKALSAPEWRDEGPFELSPERGRYALTYSLVEDGTLFFSQDIARFVTPDLGYLDGKYVSLFAPGLSFLVAPGFYIGKLFGFAQLGSFLVVSSFAFLNSLLIAQISKRLGAGKYSGLVAALIFLFATPAYAYGVTLYQHHITTFVMLASILILMRKKIGFRSLGVVWMLLGFSLSIDYPNVILLSPIGIWALDKIIKVAEKKSAITFNISIKKLLAVSSVIVPLSFFVWFNASSYGNPLKLAGTVPGVDSVAEDGSPVFSKIVGEERVADEDKSAVLFFDTKNISRGLAIHLFSFDRGVSVFSPILLLSLFGIVALYKRQPKETQYLLMLIGVNLLLYSLWGDPWGGWAFGSRYLIPSYALLAIFCSFSLKTVHRNMFILPIILAAFSYSLFVNELGAITSSKNPPKIEAVELEKVSGRHESYTYLRNLEYLHGGVNKSFVYRTYLSTDFSPSEYFLMLYLPLVVVSYLFVMLAIFNAEGEK